MNYGELIRLDETEQNEVLLGLSDEEIADLWDEKPFSMAEFTEKEGRKYFDTIEDLHDYLWHNYYPATKSWMADETAVHERAHAECALALGAAGVKYSVTDALNLKDATSVFAHFYGSAEIPNLAWAAISMHPYTASQSRVDMRNIKQYGYKSRDHVTQRIRRWNEHDSGLYIPEPQKQPPTYL